ncbi:ABC transporter permease [Haloarcula salinisoli]|uniref:ABC transporter permease n=1 Tax=Haloarcula salinisoli TaxID=2487746 RepID=A0A8J8CB72_9EURY|nr:ABC transporter permease [Halomicroarcula salinisoli]MBX0288425.1 ABC transporter permease [Halomicroarcula salinisoli]MBX0305909.1 ABC transporter permease [Halomicroarcula salinisoli]
MSRNRSRTESVVGRLDWLSAAFVLGGLLLCYYLVPLVSLVLSQPPGAVLRSLQSPIVVSATATSLTAALLSTAIATVFGLGLAYWLAHAEGPLATLVTSLVVLPLVLPPVVSGLLLLTVVGRGTLVGQLAAANGLALTRSFVGVVLAQTFVASPFVVITAKAAFESVDRSLEDAARTLGQGRFGTFRRVTLPLAWPGVLAGITLAFARAIGEFGATVMLAYYPRTMPVQIWVSFRNQGLETAFPVALILVGVAVATILVLNVLGTNPLE